MKPASGQTPPTFTVPQSAWRYLDIRLNRQLMIIRRLKKASEMTEIHISEWVGDGRETQGNRTSAGSRKLKKM